MGPSLHRHAFGQIPWAVDVGATRHDSSPICSICRAAGVIHGDAERATNIFNASGEPDLAVLDARFHAGGPGFIGIHVKRADRQATFQCRPHLNREMSLCLGENSATRQQDGDPTAARSLWTPLEPCPLQSQKLSVAASDGVIGGQRFQGSHDRRFCLTGHMRVSGASPRHNPRHQQCRKDDCTAKPGPPSVATAERHCIDSRNLAIVPIQLLGQRGCLTTQFSAL